MPTELTVLEDKESAFTAQRWPMSAALIGRECPDMMATLRLILMSEFPVGIRETLAFAQDLLSEVLEALPAYTAKSDGDGAGQGADSDLPGSFRVL